MPCKGEELVDDVPEQCHGDENKEQHTSSSPIALKPTQPMTIPGADTTQSLDDTLNSFVDMSMRNLNPSENGSVKPESELEKKPQESDVQDSRASITWDAVPKLAGEELKPDHTWDMAYARAFMSNYRLVIITYNTQGVTSIPVHCIDTVETYSDDVIKLVLKDGRQISCRVKSRGSDVGLTFCKAVLPYTCGGMKVEDSFAYRFAAACQRRKPSFLRKNLYSHEHSLGNVTREFEQCSFSKDWRITRVNEDFGICASYPQYLIVPTQTTDEELKDLKRGRFFDRFPNAVWRSKKTGAVLMRSAQPETSFFGAQSEGDAKLFEAICQACIDPKSGKSQKIAVMDARSYTAALANKAKGGGYESGDAYANADVQFMALPNIHSLRYAFNNIRAVLNAPDAGNYFQGMHQANWFQYLQMLLTASQKCVDILCVDGTSVLVHCSDGWDRTAQIVSLAKLIADPYYRTFEGFEYLVNREWVEFGHKFHERNGVSPDNNEKSPIFMQFLDAVHQLWLKNPDAFEFNQRYLMKLAQHHHSALFGTFMFNNFQESINGYIFNANNSFMSQVHVGSPDDESIVHYGRVPLLSVFDYLGKHNALFYNPVYDSGRKGRLLCPKNMGEFTVWREVFCCTDVEGFVNNPERVTVESPVVYEEPKVTMSRSQSASSLNSLEPSQHHNHGVLNTSGGSQPVPISSTPIAGSSFINNYQPTYHPRRTDWKHHLDVDGLSHVPIDYEDRCVQMHRQCNSNEFTNRVSESSSSGRDTASRQDNNCLRQRMESNDSASIRSYDLCDDDGMHRRKRDSASSNLLFAVDMNMASSPNYGSLMEEETRKCDFCNNSVAMDESSSMTTSSSTLINGTSNSLPTAKARSVTTCARCASKVPIHSPNRMIMS